MVSSTLEAVRPSRSQPCDRDSQLAPQIGNVVVDAATPRPRRAALAFVPGFLGAVVLHGAIALALLASPDEPFGASGVDLDAVSVEIVDIQATARESRAASATADPASAAVIDQTDGATAQPPASEAAPPEAKRAPLKPEPADAPDETQAEPLPVLALTKPDVTPPQPEAIVLPLRQPEPPKQEPARHPQPSPPQQAYPREAEGGAAAQSATGSNRPARVAAIASPGAVQAFAKSVVDALSRTRPKGIKGSARGTTKVAFAVAEGGGLEFVRITRSSGHETLDEAAIAAVRRAAFPAPPAGMALAQRTYEIPYHFR